MLCLRIESFRLIDVYCNRGIRVSSVHPRMRAVRRPIGDHVRSGAPHTVHSQIEAQCKASGNKPVRKKSFTRSVSDNSRGPSRSDSPYSGDVALPKPGKARESSDASSTNSGTPAAAPQAGGTQLAGEKSMTKKLFGRMSVDKESGHGYSTAEQGEKQQQHKRTASLMSGRRSSLAGDDPGSSPSEVRFICIALCIFFSRLPRVASHPHPIITALSDSW